VVHAAVSKGNSVAISANKPNLMVDVCRRIRTVIGVKIISCGAVTYVAPAEIANANESNAGSSPDSERRKTEKQAVQSVVLMTEGIMPGEWVLMEKIEVFRGNCCLSFSF
jgi:hypothetical protein